MTTPMQIPQMTKPFEEKGTPNPSSQQEEKPTQQTLTSPQPDPVIDPNAPPAKTPEQLQIEEYQRKERAYLQRQREQDSKMAQLTSVVEKLVTEKDAPPPQTPEEDAKEFYRDPRKVIREVMEETVRPLNQFKTSYESDSAYSRLKAQYKADPRFAQYFQRDGFEQMVDQVITQSLQSGVTVNEQFVESVLTHTAGQIAVGTVQMPDPIADANQQRETPQVDDRQIPPYLQPSAPPSVQRGQEPRKYRPLNENEDRIRREQGMSVEDWWKWQEVPSTDVIDSKIGIQEKK